VRGRADESGDMLKALLIEQRTVDRWPDGVRRPPAGASATRSLCCSPLLSVAGRLRLRMNLLHLRFSNELGIIRLLTRFATKLPLNDEQPWRNVVAERSNVS